MYHTNIQELEAEWTAQVKAACESLAYLRAADASAVVEGGLSRKLWLFHMDRLNTACHCLGLAADTLLEAMNHCYDKVLAAGQGKDYDLLEWQPARKQTTVLEAGSKGGRTVKERYGPGHFVALGKLGGETTRRKGPEHYAALGKAGGKTTKSKLGPEYFSQIGRKGGASTAQRGYEYYSRIGKLGGTASRKSTQRKEGAPS